MRIDQKANETFQEYEREYQQPRTTQNLDAIRRKLEGEATMMEQNQQTLNRVQS